MTDLLIVPAAQPWHDRRFVWFKGQFDTKIKTGEDYPTQALHKLFTMRPGDKAKGMGLAMIPSSYADFDAREHNAQREHGRFIALTGDVDSGNHSLEAICEAVRTFAGDAAWFVYSSAHARPGDMRWRIILPLEDEQGFAAWHDAQCAFFAFMEDAGIAMDHALARAAQPVYLPNVPAIHAKSETPLRGEDGQPLFYATASSGLAAPGLSLDTGLVQIGIAAIRHQRVIDEQERDRIRREAEARRANQPRGEHASIIEDFNAENSVATMLELCGYEQSPRHAEDWRSPQQTGDTYATRVIGSKWVSLSASDAASGLGTRCSAGCFGDAYDLFVHYRHGGDHKAAFRALHAERRAAQGNVIYPREFDPPQWLSEVPMPEEMPEWAEPETMGGGDFVEDMVVAPPQDDSTFEFLTLGELRRLPPPDWLIHEAIVSDGLSIIYGEPGAGKSFIALDMALRLALGTDWHGLKTKRTGILYIAGEGVRGIGKRVEGWARFHDVSIDELPFVVIPVAAQLLDPAERARLIRTIDAVKARLDFDVGLTIVDTVSRSIAGQDENGQETMSAFVKACDDIKMHTGGAMIGIHHSGKDKERGMRGSTVLLGACDASIRLTKAERIVTLAFEKQKDAEEQPPIYFELERFAWSEEGHEDELTTLIPKRADKPNNGVDSVNRDQIRRAFGILSDAWADGRPLSHRPETRKDGRHAPSIFVKRLGGDAEAWATLLAHWLENGNVSFEMFDTNRKMRGLKVLEPVL